MGFTEFMEEAPNWNWNPKITEEIAQAVDDQISRETLAKVTRQKEIEEARLERPFKVKADYMDDGEYYYFAEARAVREYISSYLNHNPNGTVVAFYKESPIDDEDLMHFSAGMTRVDVTFWAKTKRHPLDQTLYRWQRQKGPKGIAREDY